MTTAIDPTIEMEFRCDGCACSWRCWSYRKLDSEATFLTIAKRHGWLKCAKCSREPASRVA